MEIVVKANAGLGNRMRVLSSCIALQKDLNCQIKVIWERNNALNCRYDQLFKPLPNILVEEWNYLFPFQRIMKTIRSKKLERLKTEAQLRFYDIDIRNLRQMKQDIRNVIANNEKVFIDTCERFYGEPTSVSELIPIDQINELVQGLSAGNGFLGVHIRQGDSELSVKHSPIHLFEERLKKEIENEPGIRVFLASDSNAVLSHFKALYGDRIFTHPSSKNRKKSSAIQAALVDLLTLSRATKILGSYWSSFSDEAANYGKVELEILMHDDHSA